MKCKYSLQIGKIRAYRCRQRCLQSHLFLFWHARQVLLKTKYLLQPAQRSIRHVPRASGQASACQVTSVCALDAFAGTGAKSESPQHMSTLRNLTIADGIDPCHCDTDTALTAHGERHGLAEPATGPGAQGRMFSSIHGWRLAVATSGCQ